MGEINVNGRTFYHVFTGSVEEIYSKEGENNDSFHSALRHKGFSWSIYPSSTSEARSMDASASPNEVAIFLHKQDVRNKLIKK